MQIFLIFAPSKSLPMHRCRTYRLMNPQTGIWALRGNVWSPDGWSYGITTTHTLTQLSTDYCPHTYGVRYCPCGPFATDPCRPTACIPAAPFRHTPYRFRPRRTATVWRNLQQHPRTPSSHTFSAKERDTETGLSYFGARYYSSDLSIWLSVDPMSDKYPSLSPYVYCADNPVRLVDPNGEDPIYAKNFWGNVKKIGDDGQCGLNSYLVLGDKAKEVKAATKKGVFYTGDLSSSDLVIHIPTGQIQQDVQYTVEQSLRSGDSPENRVEYGGHSLIYGIFIRIAPWFHLVILKKWMVGAPMALKEVLLSSVQMTGKCHFTMNQKL